MENISLQPSAN